MAEPKKRGRPTKYSGIYALIHDGVIYYIGQAKDIDKRYAQHCSLAQNQGNTKRQSWLRSLLEEDIKPNLWIIEKTDDLNDREIHWISYFQSNGNDLKNLAKGGKDIPGWTVPNIDKPWKGQQSPIKRRLHSVSMTIRQRKKRGLDTTRQEYLYQQMLNRIREVGRDRMNYLLWEKYGE